MQSELEPTLLEYARYHGLARNHRERKCLQDICFDIDFQDQGDDQSLFQFEDHAADPEVERLHVDRRVVELLSTITRPPIKAYHFDENDEPRTNVRRGLKQEVPLLKTDHEDDLRRFAPRFDPSLHDEYLPLEGLDEELDEGLGWPSKYLDLPQRIEQEYRAERLVVSKDVIQYLVETLTFEHVDDLPAFDEADLPVYKKVIAATWASLVLS